MRYRVQTLHDRHAAILELDDLLDVDAVLELREAIDAILERTIHEIIVDLEEVGIVNSAGWGVFISKLAVVERARGHFRFAAMHPEVRQIFELLGLPRSPAVTVHATVEEAVQASHAGIST